MLKYKLNQNESLALAKQHLNLDCRDEEVEYVYSKLQSVAKKFAQCSEKIKRYEKSYCSKSVCVNPQYSVHKTVPSTHSSNQSGKVQSASSNGHDESLTEKTISSLPVKIVAGQFGSDSELDCPGDQPKDHTLLLDSQQHQSPISLPSPKSVVEPSEISQAQCNLVGTGSDLKRTTNATQSNEECVETDAVTSERATVAKISQHEILVTQLLGNSNVLEFIETDQSLVEADVNSNESNSLPCTETAFSRLLPIRPSSSESNTANIPVCGIEHNISSNQRAFCQEAVVPTHPSLEVPLVESSGASIMQSLLPQQPTATRPLLESETFIENQRSTNTLLSSPNELPCTVNTVRPVTLQPACSNPLQIELERILKFKGQTLKLHEAMISRLKSDRDKEIEEIYKKYDLFLRDAEMAFKQNEQDLESYYCKVHLNDLLAGTLIFCLNNNKASGSPVISSFIDQLIQQLTPILDPQTEVLLTGLGAAPPVQISNHSPPSVTLDSSSVIHVAQSNRVGIRAPAPHLRALNPQSMSTPHMANSHERMLNQLAVSNPQTIPVFPPDGAPRLPSESSYIHPPIGAELPGFNSYVPPPAANVDSSNHAGPDLEIS